MVATKTKLEIKTEHKEVWLGKAAKRARGLFKQAGYVVPDNMRISTGWPSRGAVAEKKRVIGQAWSNENSEDGTHEIIISVYLADPIDVLETLIHEMAHVTVGVDAQHGKPFVDCIRKIGLEGKPTATCASEELKGVLSGWIESLGAYPHARLDGSKLKKQSTRLIKLECKSCGCIVRVSRKWTDVYAGEWPCPCNGELEEVE